MTDREELGVERVAALEKQLAELRTKLAEPQAIATVDMARRRRVAVLLLVGGGVAGLSGVFAHSILMIVFGIGWIFGGAAVGSTLPQARDDD